MRAYDRSRPLAFLVLRVSEAAGGGRVAIGLNEDERYPKKPPANLAAFFMPPDFAQRRSE
jgi:hypothetical protein